MFLLTYVNKMWLKLKSLKINGNIHKFMNMVKGEAEIMSEISLLGCEMSIKGRGTIKPERVCSDIWATNV